ncbi:ABC transporter substrate-binding protein [Vibrio mediterranei]|uniref:ABC transporter substrate-binding protein n=1 Tax=Vibrio mediterranei TaxID=689 RepID=UPI0022847B29|nr:ABC transporter substrate-binding protein [Vibrio mediterranei]MCY9856229.1 ABC transporter substrate-binding protein [Vibrio mediterranei]
MKKTLLLTSAIAASMVIPAHAEESSSMPNLKILNEFSTGWVRNFNPWFGGRSDFAYESLYIFDILDSKNVHPWLATGYELSDDLTVLTVDLREGVLWSDGKPFTADDVVFTYEYPKAHPEIDTGGVSGKVDKVEKVNDLQVKIYLKEPNAFAARDVLGETVRIVPKHIWEGNDSPAQSTNDNPVGTGPFTEIQRFTPQVYVQCRNPNYWNKDLKIDCLEFPQFSSNDAALEMLSKGIVDWAGIFIPDIERTFVSKHPNNKYWFPSNDGVRITFNYKTENEGANKAFHDVNFRKAVSLSMDREAMMMIGSYGYVVGGNPATNLPKGMWNWRDEQADKTWAEVNQYDINKAKQLLADGGYKDTNGDGFVENPDGSKLTFKIQVPSGWSDWVNNTSIAVEGLRMAGIDATVVTPEANAYAKNWETANFDATFGAGSMQSSVWKFYDFTMGSEYVQSPVWWSTTVSNYVDPQLDQWISELGLTKDEDQQKKIAANVERYFAENVIQIPLYYNGIWYAYNDSRFEGWANEDNQIGHPAPWNGMSRLVHLMNLKPKG